MTRRTWMVCLCAAVGLTTGCKKAPPQKTASPDPPPAAAATSAPATAKPKAKLDARGAAVVKAIRSFNSKLSEADRAAKYARMAASRLGFFRGTNHLYWSDMGLDKRLDLHGSDQTRIWLQGDAHLFNIGAFRNSRRKVVYDLTDFDESVVADYQLDLWRLAVSVVLVAEQNNRARPDEPPFSADAVTEAVTALGEAYLQALKGYIGNDDEEDTVITAKNAFGKLDEFLEKAKKKNSRKKMLAKWAKMVDGRQVLKDGSDYRSDQGPVKLAKVGDDVVADIENALPGYARTLSGGLPWSESYFAVKSVRRRLNAGTGSLGTLRYYVLIEGRKPKPDDDVILDVKLQGPPAAYPHLSDELREFNDKLCQGNHALRAVTAQRAMGAHVDDHLGWLKLKRGTFSVRQRSPYKETFDVDKLTSTKRLLKLAKQWGAVLATAHARADDDWKAGAIGYSLESEVAQRAADKKRTFLATLTEVATDYAARVNGDYRAFCARLARCPDHSN